MQCDAVWCSVLQHTAVRCSLLFSNTYHVLQCDCPLFLCLFLACHDVCVCAYLNVHIYIHIWFYLHTDIYTHKNRRRLRHNHRHRHRVRSRHEHVSDTDTHACFHMCAMNCSYLCHDSFICVPWLVRMCAMTHSYVCQDSFTCMPWLIHLCAMTHSYVCHGSFICVPWLIHLCTMAHSHVGYDSSICVSWPIHMCTLTHSYVCHSFTCVPWPIHMCVITLSHVCHDSFTSAPCVFQIQHQDHITPRRAYILPHGVLGKSKNAASLYMRATTLSLCTTSMGHFFSCPSTAQEWRNRTVVEHTCSKM